jgi:hypothetical protein
MGYHTRNKDTVAQFMAALLANPNVFDANANAQADDRKALEYVLAIADEAAVMLEARFRSRSRQEVLAGYGTGRRKYLLVDGQEVLEEVWFTADEYEEAQVKVREGTGGNLHYCPVD